MIHHASCTKRHIYKNLSLLDQCPSLDSLILIPLPSGTGNKCFSSEHDILFDNQVQPHDPTMIWEHARRGIVFITDVNEALHLGSGIELGSEWPRWRRHFNTLSVQGSAHNGGSRFFHTSFISFMIIMMSAKDQIPSFVRGLAPVSAFLRSPAPPLF